MNFNGLRVIHMFVAVSIIKDITKNILSLKLNIKIYKCPTEDCKKRSYFNGLRNGGPLEYTNAIITY